MNRYLCKKEYIFYDDPMFIEGSWYEGEITRSRDGVIYYNIDESEDKYGLTLDRSGFEEHFYTVDEVREMEINKILC